MGFKTSQCTADIWFHYYIFFSIQAIQDITRTYDIPPEDIVTLIYEKIDVHGEGEEHQIGGSSQTALWCLAPQHGTQLNTVFNLLFVGRRADAGGVHQRGQGASRHHGDAHQDDGSHPRPGNHRQRPAEEGHKMSSGHVWAGSGAGEKGLGTTDGEPGPVLHCHTKNCTVLDWGALCTTDSCPYGSRGTVLCCLLELLQFWVLSITRAWAPEIANGRGGPISFQLEMEKESLDCISMEVCNLKILCETLESQIWKNSDGFGFF